jgi:hypothetical protein
MFGVADLKPLALGSTAVIVGYALVCSSGPNDVLKSALITRLWTRTVARGAAGAYG